MKSGDNMTLTPEEIQILDEIEQDFEGCEWQHEIYEYQQDRDARNSPDVWVAAGVLLAVTFEVAVIAAATSIAVWVFRQAFR